MNIVEKLLFKIILKHFKLKSYKQKYRRDDFVLFNKKCIECGFPNYDYQVRKDSGLCVNCALKKVKKLYFEK